MKRSIAFLLTALTVAATADLAEAKKVINVDFAPSINDPSVTTNIYTIDYVGTAAAADAGTIWNHINANTAAPAAFIGDPGYYDAFTGPSTTSTIVDSLGNVVPGVSVTINNALGAFASGNNSVTDGDAGAGLDYISTQAQGLMRDYLIANGGTPGLVTIAGLTPGKVVDLYAYGEGDNASNDRQTKFTANGVVGATAGFAGKPHETLVLGKDYVVLPGVVANASGVIEIKFELNGGGEAPFNGFQAVFDVLAGDANDDNFVNLLDYQLIRDNFQKTNATRAQGDVTGPLGGNAGDGVVDFYDFALWQAHFPTAVPFGVNVPEPSTLAIGLSAVGALACFRRNRG